jgi:prepilin-type N-terminal cleavage/methylation domain-containing protein
MNRAFTLIELLIAMVLTLILVTAIAQFYAVVGDSVKDGRAIIEMGGRIRTAQLQLLSDLEHCTSPAGPWVDESLANGYFEYFEGRATDFDWNGDGTHDLTAATTHTNMLGDGDDFLAFTIRSLDQPLTGRVYNPNTNETSITQSNLAEVIWWVGFDDENGNSTWDFDEPRNIYRRQLLIRPDITGINGVDPDISQADGMRKYQTKAAAMTRLRTLQQQHDLSLSARGVRRDNGTMVYRIDSNSISDVCRREHRFHHDQAELSVVNQVWLVGNFPFRQMLLPSISAKTQGVTDQTSFVLQGDYQGEDVMLSSVLGFDVQIYDPYARLWPEDASPPTVAVGPSDAGYAAAVQAARNVGTPPLVGLGAYVDLGYYRTLPALLQNESNTSGINPPHFAGLPAFPPALPAAGRVNYLNQLGLTFDTWPLAYERDGMFQLASWGAPVGRMDLASNGLDDIGPSGGYDSGVDDPLERETNAPYPNQPRGIQVKIRVYEPSTRQVRQVTVASDFVNE